MGTVNDGCASPIIYRACPRLQTLVPAFAFYGAKIVLAFLKNAAIRILSLENDQLVFPPDPAVFPSTSTQPQKRVYSAEAVTPPAQ